jgi:hypothetical protein
MVGLNGTQRTGLTDVLEIIKLKYMTKVDFTNWLHKELHEVFNREQTPEQMMVRAIPMIDATFSQNSGKPFVSRSLPSSSEMGKCRICGGDQCDSDSHK